MTTTKPENKPTAEELERARLANARRFTQGPEGRALMVKEFDRARGRPLLVEVKP